MSRLGEDVQYTVGYRQDWDDESGFYHAFLTADNGSILIDPLMVAQTLNNAQPMGLLSTSEGKTLIDQPDEVHSYEDIFGNAVNYSASPIEVSQDL
jgi:hypothetical protein